MADSEQSSGAAGNATAGPRAKTKKPPVKGVRQVKSGKRAPDIPAQRGELTVTGPLRDQNGRFARHRQLEPLPDLAGAMAQVPGGLGVALPSEFEFAGIRWTLEDAAFDGSPIGFQLAFELAHGVRKASSETRSTELPDTSPGHLPDDSVAGSPAIGDGSSPAPRTGLAGESAPPLLDQPSTTTAALPDQPSTTSAALPDESSTTSAGLPDESSTTAAGLPDRSLTTAAAVPDRSSTTTAAPSMASAVGEATTLTTRYSASVRSSTPDGSGTWPASPAHDTCEALSGGPSATTPVEPVVAPSVNAETVRLPASVPEPPPADATPTAS